MVRSEKLEIRRQIQGEVPLLIGYTGVLPEFWTSVMLGFPQPEEDQHEEDAIHGRTNCAHPPRYGS